MDKSKTDKQLCACGCGRPVNPGRQYIKGHNQKGKPSPRKIVPQNDAPLCECGCGERVSWSKSRRRWNKYVKGHGRKGFRHSPEAIAKMKEKAKARADNVAEDNRRRVWSDESRHKLSESKKRSPPPTSFRSGSENPSYKHGIEYSRPSASILLRRRKEIIEERGFVCEECGVVPERNSLLHMHHIDDDPFNNISINLKLLCTKCHNQITHPM